MDLPDFPQIQGDTQPGLSQLRDNANWAATFGEGETNLAMRAKHAGDVQDFNSALQQAHKDELNRQIMTGKNAFDFWKATNEMALREKMHAADMAAAAPLHQAQQDAAIAAADAHRAAALHSASVEKRAAAEALAKTTAQENFDAARHAAGQKFGYNTPQYYQAVTDAAGANPAASAFSKPHVEEAQKFLAAQPVAQDTAGFKQHMAEGLARGITPQSPEYAALRAVGQATFPNVHPDVVNSYGPNQMPNPDALALKERVQAAHEAQMADTATHRETKDLDKEIAALDKARPKWKGTTGIFIDKNGVERFGFPAVDSLGEKNPIPAEQSLPATPELKAEYQRYQNLVLKRAAQSAGVTIKKFNPTTGRIE